ncbi:MAG: hypothetical protein K9W44_01275 [Candidatus Lokiarchaeota archaeon]|nr:hypothetical protein [Candidatus Harpocratesius repetitus]
MPAKNPQIIPFSPRVFTDINRPQLRTHTITALIGFVIFIVMGVISATINQDSSMLISWLCAEIMWLLLWFYDNSRHVRTTLYNGSRKLMHPDHLLIGTIPPVEFDEYNFIHSFLIMQNLRTGICFIHAGFRLSATSVHIRPNFADLMRRLYQMWHNIPLTIRISLDGSKIPREFSYHLVVTKRLNAPNRGKMLKLLRKTDEALTILQSVIEAEFPHYRFEALTFEGLMNVIQGNAGQQSICEIRNSRFLWIGIFRSLSSLFFIIGLGIGLTFYSFQASLLRNWFLGIFFGFFCMILVIDFLRRSFLIRHHHKPFELFTLFSPQSVLNDSNLQTSIIQNVDSEQISIPYTFTLQTFHRAFRFQSIKFYRNLIYQLTHLSQARSHRISTSIEF